MLEFIDILDTEYFESALHDMLEASYKQHLRAFLQSKLSADSAEERQPMIKLVTQTFVLHQSEAFLEPLRLFDFPEVQAQVDMLIKLIYFEDPAFEQIEIRDLVEGGSERQESGLGGLEQLLQGRNLEGIMRMLGEAS